MKLSSNITQQVIDLYREHYPVLYRYGLKIHADEDIVKDCIQDCFFDLWERPEKLTRTTDPKPYLLRMLRNMLLKQKIKPGHRELTETDAEPDFSMEQLLITTEQDDTTANRLKTALATLTPGQQEIVYLRYYDQLSYEQIEQVTGLQYQSIRNQLSRTLKKLREQM